MSVYHGKALMMIERQACRWTPFIVNVRLLSCSGNLTNRYAIEEDLTLGDFLPAAAMRMEVDDRIWVKVSYEITYSRDWEGEWSMFVDFTKSRVIKRRRHPYNHPDRIMLYTTLLRKVLDYVTDHPRAEESLALAKMAKEGNRSLSQLILNWDVRCIGDLRDRVAPAFPRVLRKGVLQASQNIHGKWRVDPA